MTYDIVLAGVGGQGVLSLANLVAAGALDSGCVVKQSEVHGMSQRGGAVSAHLRLSTGRIESELIPLGSADMILSLEPLESLRYLEYLRPGGSVVTAVEPVKNIANYPPVDEVLAWIAGLPHIVTVEATTLARRAGLARAINAVMAGAAAPMLPVPAEALERCIRQAFASKGPAIVEQNLAAFHAGLEASCTEIL